MISSLYILPKLIKNICQVSGNIRSIGGILLSDIANFDYRPFFVKIMRYNLKAIVYEFGMIKEYLSIIGKYKYENEKLNYPTIFLKIYFRRNTSILKID
jgi:hypothetical protein